MFTKAFWIASVKRAIHTGAQSFVAAIGSTAIFEGVDWSVVGSVTGMAVVLSLAKSLAVGVPEVPASVAAAPGPDEAA